MKQLILDRVVPITLIAGVFVSITYNHKTNSDKTYMQGYQDAVKCYQQWLLDVDFAEYNKKTGDWQLVDPNTIQGNLIEPQRRPLFVNVDDHVQSLEHELQLAKKQQLANKKTNKSNLDIKKLP